MEIDLEDSTEEKCYNEKKLELLYMSRLKKST